MTQLVVVSVVAELIESSNPLCALADQTLFPLHSAFVGSVPLSGTMPFFKEWLAHALLNPRRGS